MKKTWFIFYFLWTVQAQSQFVDFVDKSSRNRFLGLDLQMCKTTTNNSSKNYQKSYDCGNNTISGLLNVNFVNPSVLGKQFYMFNNFMYWIGDNNKSDKDQLQAQQQPDQYFSGAGVFMVVIGTSPYLQQLVPPKAPCPSGKTVLVAQLKYNDGNSISCWSQDSICVGPTDKFTIQITDEADDTVSDAQTNQDAQGIDLLKDPGPKPCYQQAGSSPRKIRLVLQ